MKRSLETDTRFVYRDPSKAKAPEKKVEDATVRPADEEIQPKKKETVSKEKHVKREAKADAYVPNTDRPRDLFLTLLAFVWFCAFTSLFVQLDGLFGSDGLAPAETNLRARIAKKAGTWDWMQAFAKLPTLLWVPVYFNLDLALCMKLLCGVGMLLSLQAIRTGGNSLIFGTMWACYLSMFSVGSVFMQFQWDTLLLEVGFLAIWLACPRGSPAFSGYAPRTIRQLLRFTLFKLMLMSGVVKLQSGCPSWYKLTALSYHFATQCLPTPVAWWVSKLPENVLKLSVWSTLVIEIPTTALLLSPFQIHRWTGFCLQIPLQVAIMLTGNYNFFNLLTIALCILLLNTDGERKGGSSKSKVRVVLTFINFLLGLALLVGGILWILPLSVDRSSAGASIYLATTPGRVSTQMKPILLASILAGFLYLLACGLLDIKCASGTRSAPSKLSTSLKRVLVVVGSLLYFIASGTALLSLDRNMLRNPIAEYAVEMYSAILPYHITSGYGLFRRTTGMGDNGRGQVVERPEVILFGSHDGEHWEEFDFRHKPGNVSWVPTIVAPHQPRLDWQMWFAALGPAKEHPWFMNLVYKLLLNSKAVRDLMSPDSPFSDTPPRFIKADLYTYDFSKGDSRDWWSRKFSRSYLDAVDADSQALQQYVKTHGFPTRKVAEGRTQHHGEDLRETIIFTCAFIAVYEVIKRSLEVVQISSGCASPDRKVKVN